MLTAFFFSVCVTLRQQMEFKSMDRKKEENDTTKLENPIMQETVRRRETRGES
jgi:hypothetical protein